VESLEAVGGGAEHTSDQPRALSDFPSELHARVCERSRSDGREELRGAVDSAKIIMDRESGRSTGCGFVEMPDDSEAQAAIKELNEAMMNGRPLRVNGAKPRS